ncbi:hypothetical protein ACFWJV_30075 [Streptomyces rochei]|uniref:hypothetical protein n=1 Tax=Streptomyces TaxID=1883 RepID=UPI000F745303|nr:MULTISPECIES: hypothetical protein [unclassified Streptomyces]RSS04232.1 hypothetical protein EF913_05160 [Streptomyces sp. WAC04189]RSS63135.1 hypothetical protein EF907_29575 [Streptomyces sp. WAC06273]
MVVDEAVAAAIRGQSSAQVATFVASCAERMVQVFTGLCGDDPARSGDVDFVVRAVGELWNPEGTADVFLGYVDTLERFKELDSSDEEIVEVARIYKFYSILALYYAIRYRSRANYEDALKCAHACLTAMGQLDQNLPKAEFFAQEALSQRRVISEPPLEGSNTGHLSQLRECDRTVGQERLAAIQSRLAG